MGYFAQIWIPKFTWFSRSPLRGEILIGQKCFFIQTEGGLSFFCEIWQSVLGHQSYKVHSAHPPPAFLHGGGKLSLQPNFQKVGA